MSLFEAAALVWVPLATIVLAATIVAAIEWRDHRKRQRNRARRAAGLSRGSI